MFYSGKEIKAACRVCRHVQVIGFIFFLTPKLVFIEVSNTGLSVRKHYRI
uniref:Uncharacterized protein n=1 Tax=Arion vulgaris TaxID=1028688 RepID=A0A0B6YT89_9EUPU